MAQKKLPIYKLIVTDNEESGVNFNSFVGEPATEEDFFIFSKEARQEVSQFKIDEKRRIVTGVMMVADKPIYRNSNGEEFMVVFDAETIEKIAIKFFADNFNNNVNTEHANEVQDVVLFESMVIDKRRGITAPKGFPKLNEGTWIASYKINNDMLWDDVMNGKFKGFSVEGVFNKQLVKMDKDLNLNKYKMSDKKKELFEGLKSLVSKYLPKEEVVEVKMTENILVDGETMVVYDAEVIATGIVVSLVDSEGQLQAMPQGSYELQDGTTFDIVDEEGTADNVVLAEAPAEEGAEPAEEAPAATGADMKESNATGQAKRVVKTTIEESNFNKEEMKEINEKFEALNKKVEALEAEKAEFAKVKESELKAKEDTDNKLKELFELVEKFGAEPAAKPTVSKPKKFDATAFRKEFRADINK
tara:strand:- start:1563 stop:2813 length:1251 start_codon:yes stop_codon:yes gene_type:complete